MRKLILAAAAAATLVAPTVAMASSGQQAPTKGTTVHICVSHTKHGLKARLAQKCRTGEKGITIRLVSIKAANAQQGPQGPQGPRGSTGATGLQGPQGPAGANGVQGSVGPQGANGVNGTNGANGATGSHGPQGPAGVSSPFTWSYTGLHSLDSGDSGDDWANDMYNTEFAVTPLADGSYLVVKYITGTFTTIPGVAQPQDHTGTTVQRGGVTGTFTGVETWTISDSNGPAAFDPTATPDLNNMTSNEGQNAAFTQAFFPGESYSLSNYDFVYHTASNGSWVDSNGVGNDTGSING